MKSVRKVMAGSTPNFPKLMEGNSDLIVLMVGEGCGTVVNDPWGNHNLGWYSEDWGMKHFSDFNGTIELSNDE